MKCTECNVALKILGRYKNWECSKVDCPERKPLTANGDEHPAPIKLEDDDDYGERTPS